jgi:hypothetical protein
MIDMSSTAWRRRGSSVVFDKGLLGPLISEGCLVSLREALSWVRAWPSDPPAGHSTVLVGGLETCLEVLPPAEGEDFLRRRLRRFLKEFQAQWDQTGLVFGFGCSPKRFALDSYENVLFALPGGTQIRLSENLWNGAALHDLTRLVTIDPQTHQQGTGGYYVRHLS